MDIFGYTDSDDDRLTVGPPPDDWDSIHEGSLAFTIHAGGSERSCALRPADVDRLAAALDMWRRLPPTTAKLNDPEPIYRALVRRLAAEEVQRVMPLHWSPQAAVPAPARCDGTACCGPHPVDPDALRCDFDCSGCHSHEDDEPVFCTIEDCDLIPDRTYHLEHDPEPQDVGHPAEPVFPSVHLATAAECKADREGAPCVAARHLSEHGALCDAPLLAGQFLAEVHSECGFVWAMHRRAPGVDWSDALFGKPDYEPEPDHGRLMAELPRRKPLASLYCDGCRHLWSDHGLYGIRGCHEGAPENACECSRVQPRSE